MERVIVAGASGATSVLIHRRQDYDEYYVRVSFAAGFELRRVGPHAFVIAKPLHHRQQQPSDDDSTESLWVSVGFAPVHTCAHNPPLFVTYWLMLTDCF